MATLVGQLELAWSRGLGLTEAGKLVEAPRQQWSVLSMWRESVGHVH